MSQTKSSPPQGQQVEASEITRFRILIMKKGRPINNMKELQRVFKKGDLGGSGELSRFEFKALVHLLERLADENGYGPFYPHTKFTDAELDDLFSMMDPSGLSKIPFSTFFYVVRGTMPTKRSILVSFAYNRLDVDNRGYITSKEMQRYVHNNKCTQMLSVEKNEKQIVFDIFKELLTNGEGKITRPEFEDYYSSVSVFMATDKDFEELIYSAWSFTPSDISEYLKVLAKENKEMMGAALAGGGSGGGSGGDGSSHAGSGAGSASGSGSGSLRVSIVSGMTPLPGLVGNVESGKRAPAGSRAVTPPGDDSNRRAKTPMSSERGRGAGSRRPKTLSFNPPDMPKDDDLCDSPKPSIMRGLLGSPSGGATPIRSINITPFIANPAAGPTPDKGTPQLSVENASSSASAQSGTKVSITQQQQQQPASHAKVPASPAAPKSAEETPKKGSDGSSVTFSRHEKLKRALTASPSQLSAATTVEDSDRSRGASLSSASSAPPPTQSKVPPAQLEALLASLPPDSKSLVLTLCEEAEELRLKLQEARQYKTQMDSTAAENRALRAKNYELVGQKEAVEKRLAVATSTSASRSPSQPQVTPLQLQQLPPTKMDDDSSNGGGSSMRARTGQAGQYDAARAEEVIEAQRKTISSQETTIKLLQQLLAAKEKSSTTS